MDYTNYSEYNDKRQQLIQQQTSIKYNNLNFSQKENIANEEFRKLLDQERRSKNHQFYQYYSLQNQSQIEQSKLFQIIKLMPKGGLLHLHNLLALDANWFIQEIAYDEHTYFNNELKQFKFFKSQDKVSPGYINLAYERNQSINIQEYDEKIKRYLYINEDECRNLDINIWNLFEQKISGIDLLFIYKENYKKYLNQMIKTMIMDGVYHIELRLSLHYLQDEDNNTLSVEEEISIFQQAIIKAQELCPQFSFGIILTGFKMWNEQTCDDFLLDSILIKQKYPDMILGLDFVQEEDNHQSILQLSQIIFKKELLEKKYNVELPFILHAGESINSISNTNLFDAILLNAKRIGHGINLFHHSYLLKLIKDNDICIEVCPISNQLLRYVFDIRQHPLKQFINYGIKVAICSDDPSLFGLNDLSHDFYIATIGCELGKHFTSLEYFFFTQQQIIYIDLKDLKLCVYNSITSSAIPEEKQILLWTFVEQQWDKFIDNFLQIIRLQ